jgi:hypothetical protein
MTSWKDSIDPQSLLQRGKFYSQGFVLHLAASQNKWSLRERQPVKYRCSIARSVHTNPASLTDSKLPVNPQSKARNLSPDPTDP